MGIHSDIDPLTDADIDDLIAADALLAEALAKFAAEKFQEANKANKEAIGGLVPYSVSVDADQVFSGSGEIFPENQVAAYLGRTESRRDRNAEFARAVRKIVIDWLWSKVYDRAAKAGLRSALDAAGIDDPQGLRNLARAGRIASKITSRDGEDSDKADALRWIAAELIASSPVVSGAYRRAHDLYVDGAIGPDAEMLIEGFEIPDGKVYAFVNQMSYARKLETGLARTGPRKGQPFVKQVPPHIYERVAAAAAREFGGVADIRFNYTALDADSGDAGQMQRRSRSRYEILFPTIIIRFR